MAEQVAIIGAGAMGAGIAQVCISSGHHVALFDREPSALRGALERIERGLDRDVRAGRLQPDARADALAGLRLATSIADAAGAAGIVIEATAEEATVKDDVFRTLDASAPADAVLTTNTSSLSVADRASVTRRPESVLGLHFFNPAPRMALIELVATDRTGVRAADRAETFTRSLRKVPVRCADVPGFIVNRVGRPYVLEAVRLLESGVGDVASIDEALESAGYAMGPFRLLDLIGLDVELAMDARLHEAFGMAERFRPPDLLGRLAADGRLGRKSGSGFYVETGSHDRSPSRDLPSGRPIVADDVVERLQLAMINEAYRAVADGVAPPASIDTAMRLGTAHPVGPFELVDRLGLRDVVARLRQLSTEMSSTARDQYEVATLLWQMATL